MFASPVLCLVSSTLLSYVVYCQFVFVMFHLYLLVVPSLPVSCFGLYSIFFFVLTVHYVLPFIISFQYNAGVYLEIDVTVKCTFLLIMISPLYQGELRLVNTKHFSKTI